MSYQIITQFVCETLAAPKTEQLESWSETVLQRFLPRAELVIRFVDEQEMTYLNHRYRNKTGTTNILSFPFDKHESDPFVLLGDLVICNQVVYQEAEQQGKSVEAHFAHLVVHGILHLLGHDHELEKDADIMEKLEIQILQELGYNDPYKELQTP